MRGELYLIAWIYIKHVICSYCRNFLIACRLFNFNVCQKVMIHISIIQGRLKTEIKCLLHEIPFYTIKWKPKVVLTKRNEAFLRFSFFMQIRNSVVNHRMLLQNNNLKKPTVWRELWHHSKPWVTQKSLSKISRDDAPRWYNFGKIHPNQTVVGAAFHTA